MTEKSTVYFPEDVRALVNRYIELVEGALPGRIEGLYLVGSIALADYTAGQSDVDFVAVTGDPLTPRERDRLRGVHAALLNAAPQHDLLGFMEYVIDDANARAVGGQ